MKMEYNKQKKQMQYKEYRETQLHEKYTVLLDLSLEQLLGL